MISEQNQKIKSVGKYWKVDRDGYVVNDGSIDKVQEKWRPIIEEVKNAYLSHFGNKLKSIYIRGSVARGVAKEYVSDLDTIAFVDLPEDKIILDWAKKFNNHIKNKYPFVTKVEIIVDTKEKAYSNNGNRIMLKTQSVCIYGNDLAKNIKPFRINRDLVQHAFSLRKDMDKTLNHIKRNPGQKIMERCLSIMKRMVRTGFELVMVRTHKYTRDLCPGYKEFAKYYPEWKNEMKKALQLCITSTNNVQEIKLLLNTLGKFLEKETTRVFGG